MLQSVKKIQIASQAICCESGEKDIQVFEMGKCVRCLKSASGKAYLKTGLCEECQQAPTKQEKLKSLFGSRDRRAAIAEDIIVKRRKTQILNENNNKMSYWLAIS